MFATNRDYAMSNRGQLGEFLAEVIDWRWDEFCRAETDAKFSGLQATVLALVRTASDGKLSAIKAAIDRVDGKVETPVKIEYPKIYLIYPLATSVEALPPGENRVKLADPNPSTELEPLPEPPEAESEQLLATMTLRETLKKMAAETRALPHLIHAQKKKVEAEEKLKPEEIPFVKSVIAANLLLLANEARKFEAITEVFDQIDGKLVETIKILGEDIYLAQYAEIAPAGSFKNKDGIYVFEQKEITESWKQKLSSD